MATYSDKFLLSLETTGTENIAKLTRNVSEFRAVMEKLAATNRVASSPLVGLNKDQAISNTTLTSYDRLLRVLAQLRSAQIAYAEAAKKANVPIGEKGAYASKAAGTQAVLNAAARVDSRSEAVEKELTRQRQQLLTEQLRPLREAVQAQQQEAKTAEETARNTKAAAESFEKTLLERNEAAKKEALALARQANTDRLSQVDRALAERPVANYPNADVSTHLGRAQSSVDQADTAVRIAKLKLADEYNAESRTVPSVEAAENRYLAATSAAAVAREKLALLETRSSGSFADQFRTGFKGTNADRSYAEQIGQAFKFSVFYGTAYRALSALTQTFQQTLQEGIAFQQSMTELSLATGQSADSMKTLGVQLGNEAVQAGFAPSQGVLVGARSLGLYGLTGQGAPEDRAARQIQQELVATQSARIVSRIALQSGQQPADIQNNIAAIGTAFNTGYEGQARTYDLDAYLTHKFGVAPGTTLAPVSEAGTVGSAAGYSQSEVTAIAAALVARTGQSDTAVSGYLAQIFSRGGEGSLVSVEGKYGVDPNQTLSEQIKGLAQVFKTNPGARDEIAAAGGRGKVQNAFIALLSNYSEIINTAHKADTQSPGYGDKLFGLRLNNLGGQIAVTVGELKAFASALGQSGVLDALGALLIGFRELVQTATGVLQEWNKLPRVARDTALALAALALTAKIAGGRAGLASILSSGGGAHAAEGAGLSGLFTKGNLLIAAIAADAVLYTQLQNNREKRDTAQRESQAIQANTLAPNATVDQIQAHADALQQGAKDNRDAAGGLTSTLFGKYGLGAHSSDLKAQADDMTAEAKRLQALAAAHAAAAAAIPATQASITDFSADGLSTAMQAITTAGGTAQDQLNALNSSLLGTADAAHRLAASFNPTLFAGDAGEKVYAAIQNSSGLARTHYNLLNSKYSPLSLTGLGGKPKVTEVYDDNIRSVLSQQQVVDRTQTALSNLTSSDQLTGRTAGQAARYIVGNAPTQALARQGITPDNAADRKQIDAAQRRAVKAVREALLKQAADMGKILKGVKLTDSELTAAIDTEMTATQAKLAGLPDNDYGARIQALQQQVAKIVAYIRHHQDGGLPTTGALQKLDLARHQLAEAQISRLEDLRRAAQHMAKGDAAVKAIGREFFSKELSKVVQSGDQNALATLISQAGDWSLGLAKKAIQDAINVVKAAIATEAEIQSYAASELAGIRGIGQNLPTGGEGSAGQQRRLKGLRRLLGSLAYDLPGGKGNAFDSGSDANRPTDSSATKTPGPTAAQIAAARQSALAAGSESQISQARAAMATARADMAAAKKGTTEYYSALSAFLTARNDLTAAIQSYHENLYLLSHDATNPLVQARAALRAAAQKLRSDAGKPADVRAADKVALQQAQADAESTAFNQRLEAVQTAEQLGRISYSAYIHYLDHERDRLRGIAHRSYQQQQELNQIDGLLKTAADQMQGQWNFGDIHLPTPYQVKRYIEAHSGNQDTSAVVNDGPKHRPGDTNHYVRINIDGTDTAMVIRILKNALGTNVVASSGGGRHR